MSLSCHPDISKDKKIHKPPSQDDPCVQVLTPELQRGILCSLLQALHGLHQLLMELMDHFFQETTVLQTLPESKGVLWRKRKQGRTSKSSAGLYGDLLWAPCRGAVLAGWETPEVRGLWQSPPRAWTQRRRIHSPHSCPTPTGHFATASSTKENDFMTPLIRFFSP